MVIEKKCCHKCSSEQIVKNGSNGSGNLKYKCKSCGFGRVFQTVRTSEEFRETVVRLAQERPLLWGSDFGGRTDGIQNPTSKKPRIFTSTPPAPPRCRSH